MKKFLSILDKITTIIFLIGIAGWIVLSIYIGECDLGRLFYCITPAIILNLISNLIKNA